ncbi:MAG: zinc ABC transporter solute-binding protein, partial [gamma proteobacterium symbiont of Ctena orbiculata]
MKRHRSRPSVLLALLLIGLSVIPVSHGADALRVMVSIKPMHSIIAALMAGAGTPELLIDDQIPYRFTPNEEQQTAMARADIIFWVGAELEPGLAARLNGLPPAVKVIELLSHQGMKVLPSRSDPDRRDPYFWLDNRNLLIIIDDIARLLQSADPLRSHLYARNRRNLLARLSRIDREYEYGYRGMKAGLGVQYFDTLHYFEQAYALKIIDHVSATPEGEPDTLALLKVRERIVNGEVGCLLYEKGFPVKHRTLLTADAGIRQGELNSLGFAMPAGPDLYFEIMAHNTETIRDCLDADGRKPVAATNLAVAHDVGGIGDGQFLLTDHLG